MSRFPRLLSNLNESSNKQPWQGLTTSLRVEPLRMLPSLLFPGDKSEAHSEPKRSVPLSNVRVSLVHSLESERASRPLSVLTAVSACKSFSSDVVLVGESEFHDAPARFLISVGTLEILNRASGNSSLDAVLDSASGKGSHG